ncbi:MAG: lysophospholipid acyltransferase family protein [Comamonadaceae bacterium]|nr:MAG: lysophospholipid acyltransferase family protein [Comamonadaceae bacterium]
MKHLFQALSAWPLPLLHAIGAALGWLAWLGSPTYRRRFMANAARAGLRFAQVRRAVAESGKLVAEVPRLWFGETPRVEWIGREVIEAARAAGRGIVFLTPHLGCFEVTAQAYAAQFGPITVLYRPARKPWLRDLVATARGRPNLATAPTTLAGVRQMLRVLRAGGAVGLLPDQVPPQGMGVWSSFFGAPVCCTSRAGSVIVYAGALPVLAWGERLDGGRGYRVHVMPFEGSLDLSPEAAASAINAQMERLVRAAPAQYLWGYARYKQPRREAAA